MDDLYYQLAKQVSTLTKCLKVGDDFGANNAALLARTILQRIPASRPYTKLQTNLIFVDVLNFMSLDLERFVPSQRKCMTYLRDLFDDNIVLSDIYTILSTTRMKQNNVAEALEYAGRCLLTRVNKLGIIHEKTADSHYSLGVLYRLLEDSENARKEISICRGIRCKLFGEFSLPVATCDILLGHIETQCNNSAAAYAAYFKCYHSRYLLLGEGHNLTVEAADFVSRYKYLDGERLVTSLELKNRVAELQWEQDSEAHTLQYSVAMFVNRLGNEEVLLQAQVKGLVASAAQFAVSRLTVAVPSSSSSSGRFDRHPEDSGSDEADDASSRSVALPDLSALQVASEGPSSGDLKEKMESLLADLLQSCRPSALPQPVVIRTASAANSPMKENLNASFNSSLGSSGEVKALKSPQPPPRLAKSASEPIRVHASSTSTPVSPTSPAKQSQPRDSIAEALGNTSSTREVPISRAGNPILNFRTLTNPITEPLAEQLPKHGSFAASFEASPVGKGSQSDSASKAATSRLDQAVAAAITRPSSSSPDLDPFAYRPKNIKPVSPALYKSRTVKPTTSKKASDYSLPFALGAESYILGRDSEGVLVVVRKATGKELYSCVQNKMFAVGLLHWLGRNNLKERGVPAPPPTLRSSIITAADSKRASIKATVRRMSIMKDMGASADDAGTRDPKANLLALFGNKKASLPGGGGGEGRRVSVKGPGGGPNWAKNIPMPPPIPTSWPPVPYGVGADGGEEGGAGGAGDGPGGVGSGSVNPNYDPKKPKLKQVYLVGLPSVEGTLWAERFSMPISVEELFDDLDDEFVVGAPKAKPKLSQMPAGGGSAKKASPAKKSAAESILDPQRGQNINIMLAKFGKTSLADVVKVIKEFGAESLGLSAISSLQPFVPTAEEVAKVNTFIKNSGVLKPRVSVDHLFQAITEDAKKDLAGELKARLPPVAEGSESVAALPAPATPAPEVVVERSDAEILAAAKLGKAEQYVYMLAKVPRMEARLSAMSVALTAKETCAAISNQADVILTAVGQVKGSERLKFLLKSFLDLSNSLSKNSKQSAGPMLGIKLASLAELSRTKSNSGESAELYVVSKIYQRFPDALDVANDMPGLDEAKGVMYGRLVSDLKKIEDGIALMRSLLETAEADGTPAAGVASLEQQVERTQKLFSAASTRLKESQTDYQELCAYFGEEYSDPEVLFGQLIAFLRGVQQSTNLIIAKQKRLARTPK